MKLTTTKLLGAVAVCVVMGCKPQPTTTLPPIQTTNPNQGQAQGVSPEDATKELIAKFEEEREEYRENVDSLGDKIQALEGQLASAQNQSTADRQALQQQLDEAKALREAEMQKLADVEKRYTDLQEDLDAAERENQRLRTQIDSLQTQVNQQNQQISNNNNNNNNVAVGGNANVTVAKANMRVYTANNQCIDVAGSATNAGANVIGFTCNGNLNQRFNFISISGQYLIQARNSDLCLYVAGASVNEGANIQQQACRYNGDTSGMFGFVSVGTYDFRLRNARSGRCLTIAGNGNLVQGDCNIATLFRYTSQ